MTALPRIAYITPYAILPANRGGRIRAHHLWRAMSAYADVVPIVVGDSPPPMARSQARHADAVFLPRRPYRVSRLLEALARGEADIAMPGLWEALDAKSLPDRIWSSLSDDAALVRHCLNPRRVERILQRLHRLRPDLVVLCDTTMGLLAPHVRALGVPLVVGPHNHDSDLYAALADAAPDEARRRWNRAASAAFAAAEEVFLPCADQLWVCSPEDARRFGRHFPGDRIRVVPNVYDVGAPTKLPDTRDLVFVGQAGYFPNEDAVHRLLKISGRLDEMGVAHRMRLVGRTNPRVQDLAKSYPSVDVTGEIPHVAPYLDQAALAPVALAMGGGTRLKILEAFSFARPVLSTPIGIEGIEAEDGVHAVIEPDLDAFPAQIAALLDDRARAQDIARKGWELARDKYSHEALLRIVGDALRDIGLRATAPSARTFARNLGAQVSDEAVQFNPHVRLLSWTFLVRLGAGHEALSAEFDAPGAPDLPNAFVTLKPRRGGYTSVDATAVLPADVDPAGMAVRIHAWGRPVLLHKMPAGIVEERAGLLSLEPAGEGLSLLGWADGPGETVAPAPRTVSEVTPAQPVGVRLFRATLPAPDGAQDVAVLPAEGVGQSVLQPHSALWTQRRRPSTARLRAMEGRHRGEVAWLVGNGPSVRTEDLDALAGKLTFCFNRFHLAHDRTCLRPTYTVTADKQMIEDFGQQIVDESGGTVFVAHDQPPDLLGDYIWVRQAAFFPPLFSTRPDIVVAPGGSSLFVAMQIAYIMGVRRFYIYGADFRFTFEKAASGGDPYRIAAGEGNHFIANYRSGRPWCPPSLRDIGAGFHAARRVMEAEGGTIRNASRGGLLEMFEREDFGSALANS